MKFKLDLREMQFRKKLYYIYYSYPYFDITFEKNITLFEMLFKENSCIE
jgi:hypothetical protein